MLILSFFSKNDRSPLLAVESNFLITPFDLDFAATASSSYGEFSMLSRWHHFFEKRSLYEFYREGNVAFGHSELIRFRRATKLFDQLRVVTQIIYWNEKTIYLQHKMYVKDELKSIAICRLVGWNKINGKVSPQDIFPGIGVFEGPIPEVVAQMNKMNEAINQL